MIKIEKKIWQLLTVHANIPSTHLNYYGLTNACLTATVLKKKKQLTAT